MTIRIYRNEKKYAVDDATLKIIWQKLSSIMGFDRHQKGNFYRIRSMYFDDYNRTAIKENDAGVEERKKIRIRVYDDPKSLIRLEIKNKIKGKNFKENCTLSQDQFHDIIKRELIFEKKFPKALRIFYLEMMLHQLEPTIIVEYERSTFIHNIGNIRVTLDRNISYSTDFESFLDDNIALTPLLPAGQHVLEVKYDEFLPEVFAQILETGHLSQATFSKYYLSYLSLKGE